MIIILIERASLPVIPIHIIITTTKQRIALLLYMMIPRCHARLRPAAISFIQEFMEIYFHYSRGGLLAALES